jgi:acyl-CoA thioester hydrolase
MPRIHCKSFPVPADAIDVNGHVNNKEYLRWMEEVAIEHSTAQGWPRERYAASGTSWFVRSHFVEYLRPAFERTPLLVATWVATMERRASLRRYAFIRSDDRALLARAETLWTFVDVATGRAVEIASDVRDAFPVVPDGDAEVAALSPALSLPRRTG